MADYSRLPGPNADLWDWQLRGLCRGKDSSLFFHPEGERGAARAAREQSAKEICLNCPVQKQCCEHALRVREPYGVWGGMTEEERETHYQRQKALMRARAVREKAALAEKAKLREKLLRDHERELARLAKAQENTSARGRGPVEAGVGAATGESVGETLAAAAAAEHESAERIVSAELEDAQPMTSAERETVQRMVPAERMTPASSGSAGSAEPDADAGTLRHLAPEPLAAAERMAPVERDADEEAMVPADAAHPLSKVTTPTRPAARPAPPAKKIPAAANASPRKRAATKVPESV